MMQRYFVPTEHCEEKQVTITGQDAHHIFKVMRHKIGDQLICIDGQSIHVLAKIKTMDEHKVVAEIIQHLPRGQEPFMQISIAQSLPKADKMELVIQKGTELGAVEFIPFVSERTIVQYDHQKESKRLERWQKIAKEAAEQAEREVIPQIRSIQTWKQLLTLAQTVDIAWLCDANERQHLLRPALQQALVSKANCTCLFIVGPEGGFTAQEIHEAKQANVMPISLGHRVLRTETASWVALTCLLYESGEMGG